MSLWQRAVSVTYLYHPKAMATALIQSDKQARKSDLFWNVIHVGLTGIMGAVAAASLWLNWCWWVAVGVIVFEVVYLGLVLWGAARKSSHPPKANKFDFPTRVASLWIVPFLLVGAVAAFGRVYIHTGAVYRNGDNPAVAKPPAAPIVVCSKTCKVMAKDTAHGAPSSPTPVTDPREAFYFSAVTITTVGYGDFAPTGDAQIYVCAELGLGVLLLVVTFPLVVGRISTWESHRPVLTKEGVDKVRHAVTQVAPTQTFAQSDAIARALLSLVVLSQDKTKQKALAAAGASAVVTNLLVAESKAKIIGPETPAEAGSILTAIDALIESA